MERPPKSLLKMYPNFQSSLRGIRVQQERVNTPLRNKSQISYKIHKREEDAKELTKCAFEPLPTRAPKFRDWKSHFRKEVASCWSTPKESFNWIQEIDTFSTWEEIVDDPKFKKLSASINSALTKLLVGPLKSKISLIEETLALNGDIHAEW